MYLNEYQNTVRHQEDLEEAITSIFGAYTIEDQFYTLAQICWAIQMPMIFLEKPLTRKEPWGVETCFSSLSRYLEDEHLSPKMRQELVESLKEIYQDLKERQVNAGRR